MFFSKIKFWIKNSRPYTIPITTFCWLAAFLYALKDGGNALYGLLSWVGISLVHLSTNLADDYFDYKTVPVTKDSKFKYLKDGSATIEELKTAIIVMLAIAGIFGVILFFTSGYYVFILSIIALLIAIFYSKLSSRGYGDIAVIIAYGPLMFEGVYYVMNKTFSSEIIIVSFGCAIFTEAILYAHMLMDFDEDVMSNKKTLCTHLKTKLNALLFLEGLYIIGYLLSVVMFVKSKNYLYLLPILTIFQATDLCKSLALYNKDKTSVPNIRWWHYPIENWNIVSKTHNAPFFARFLYVRNISVMYMLFSCIAIIFS